MTEGEIFSPIFFESDTAGFFFSPKDTVREKETETSFPPLPPFFFQLLFSKTLDSDRQIYPNAYFFLSLPLSLFVPPWEGILAFLEGGSECRARKAHHVCFLLLPPPLFAKIQILLFFFFFLFFFLSLSLSVRYWWEARQCVVWTHCPAIGTGATGALKKVSLLGAFSKGNALGAGDSAEELGN